MNKKMNNQYQESRLDRILSVKEVMYKGQPAMHATGLNNLQHQSILHDPETGRILFGNIPKHEREYMPTLNQKK